MLSVSIYLQKPFSMFDIMKIVEAKRPLNGSILKYASIDAKDTKVTYIEYHVQDPIHLWTKTFHRPKNIFCCLKSHPQFNDEQA